MEMLDFKMDAIKVISSQAKANETQDIKIVRQIFNDNSITDQNINELINNIFSSCDITINFHPDRFSNNGKLIIDNLIDDCKYHNQFVTGTSNGGRTAYPGGDRDIWEKGLFQGVYHRDDVNVLTRPKYGALNLLNYLDGASPRFGSCFFTLKKHVADRCTYAFGDSSANPEFLGTRDAFISVFKAILLDIQKTNKLLNHDDFNIRKAMDYFNLMKNELNTLGRNLDDCIETHIHGYIDLYNDIDSFFVDESFKDSEIFKQIHFLVKKFNINLQWIPLRKVSYEDITDDFRGPMAKIIAERVINVFGDNSKYITAALIGKASRFTIINPEAWSDLGTEYDLFQNIKKLWHTVAYFG
ncbi:MAG: DUF3626 domain-containing protein [Saccharofermentanales bacterium]